MQSVWPPILIHSLKVVQIRQNRGINNMDMEHSSRGTTRGLCSWFSLSMKVTMHVGYKMKYKASRKLICMKILLIRLYNLAKSFSILVNCNLPLRNDSCCMVPVRKCHCSCKTWILELGNADLAEQLKAVVIMESGLLDLLSHILFVGVD